MIDAYKSKVQNIWNPPSTEYVAPAQRAQAYANGLSSKMAYAKATDTNTASQPQNIWSVSSSASQFSKGATIENACDSLSSSSSSSSSTGSAKDWSSVSSTSTKSTRFSSSDWSTWIESAQKPITHIHDSSFALSENFQGDDPEPLYSLYSKVSSCLESLRVQEEYLMEKQAQIFKAISETNNRRLASQTRETQQEEKVKNKDKDTSIHFPSAAAFNPSASFWRKDVRSLGETKPIGAEAMLQKQQFSQPPSQIPMQQECILTREMLISRLIEGKREDYRRIFLPGRGWVSKVKLQSELNISDAELDGLAA